MTKVIFLNGSSSSGKTSIARSIQCLSDEPWLVFGVDLFIEMTPFATIDKNDTTFFRFIPGENKYGKTARVETTPKGKPVFALMPKFASMLASTNNNFIIDEVLFSRDCLQAYVEQLAEHTVCFIGVSCDLSIMQEREILRGNRTLGLCNDQIERVYDKRYKYDLLVTLHPLLAFKIP